MNSRNFLAGLIVLCAIGKAHAEGITDEWLQADFVGVDQRAPDCVSVTTMKRTIHVERLPDGTLQGVYGTEEASVWAQKGSASCKFAVPTASPDIYQRARLWSFLLKAEGTNSWSVGSNTAKCQGDACNEPGIKDPFATRLTLKGDVLIDAGVGVRGGALKFHRAASWQKRADDAAMAWPALMVPLDRGDCNGFFKNSLSPDAPLHAARGDYCAVIAQRLQVETQPIVSLSIGLKTAIDRRWVPDGAVEVDDVFVGGFTVFQDGSTLPRQAVLRRENGRWRVVMAWGR